MKRTIAIATGLFLLASPLVSSAQTVATAPLPPATYNQIISIYSQIVRLLEEEISILSSSPQHVIVDTNAPATVSLKQGDIAEIRNEQFYFTPTSLTASAATIQITGVGCWNSFPSDPPPQVRCMIAVMPLAPQTLSVGQSYSSPNYVITLTGISGGLATFSVGTAPTVGLGAHCGGNMANAPVCSAGLRCAPEPGSNLPFGDVGGMCVSD